MSERIVDESASTWHHRLLGAGSFANPSLRLVEIEALRGVAVLMVLFQHAAFMYPWNTHVGYYTVLYWHGAAGVDLFFAISGFVIARDLLPRLLSAHGSEARSRVIRAFFLRRFWRLQPAAWMWLMIPLPFCLWFNRSGIFQSLRANLACTVSALMGYANIRLGTYPWGMPHAGLDTQYWSLSLEEQFYVLLPLAALLLRRKLVWLMAGVLAYQFCLSWTPIYSLTRPGGFAMGVLLAVWSRHPAYAVPRPSFLAWNATTRAAFLIGSIVSLGTLESWLVLPLFSIPYGLVAVVSGVLVYAASFDEGLLLRDGPPRRLFVWFGARSYSIYLCHLWAFALTRELYGRLKGTRFIIGSILELEYAVFAMALVLIASLLTYRYVEVPSRAYARRISLEDRPAAPTLAAGHGFAA